MEIYKTFKGFIIRVKKGKFYIYYGGYNRWFNDFTYARAYKTRQGALRAVKSFL